MIKTFEEAFQFVITLKVCTVFGSKRFTTSIAMREVYLDFVNQYEINSSNEPIEDGRADR